MIAAAKKVDVGRLGPMHPNSTWEAKLCLGLTAKNGKTILSTRRHEGTLAIQRPFYPEKTLPVIYIYCIHLVELLGVMSLLSRLSVNQVHLH